MIHETTSIEITSHPQVIPWLRGRWLRAVQLGGVVITLLYGAVLVMGTPLAFERYRTLAPNSLLAMPGQLTVEHAGTLDQLGISATAYGALIVGLLWLQAVVFWGVGGVLLWKKPQDPVALILALACLVLPASPLAREWWDVHPAYTFARQAQEFVGGAGLIVLWTLFPDGRWVPPWTRWVVLAAVPYYAVYAFVVFPAQAGHPLVMLTNSILLPCVFLFVIGLQIYRYRRVSGPVQRQQTKWILLAFLLQALTLLGSQLLTWLQVPLSPIVDAATGIALSIVVIAACGFAILRYRLFDIDIFLNRTLVYGSLTTVVVGIYVLIVGSLSALFQTQGNLAVALLATGIVAVVFQPVRDRLQRTINHLMYGERDDPYAVLARLGQRLEATVAHEAVLPTVVETVAQALKLPYVAIALRQGDTLVTTAAYPSGEHGDQSSWHGALVVPLSYQGELVGQLRLAPRAEHEPLGRADQQLLNDLARQVGIAVHAVQLTRDLQHAREQLVTAREEERRRLRRDLHDGLGPALASQALTLDTVELLLERDPGGAAALVRELKVQSQAAIADIRRVVYALRPPALDDLGLVGALREQAAQYATGGLEIAVQAQVVELTLPAAIEVAAYRIVQEALTNVVRHAQARRCVVTLEIDGVMEIRVVDDGVGLPDLYVATGRRTGVGLMSMRERAEELGGTCIVEPNPGRGTRVLARLPL